MLAEGTLVFEELPEDGRCEIGRSRNEPSQTAMTLRDPVSKIVANWSIQTPPDNWTMYRTRWIR